MEDIINETLIRRESKIDYHDYYKFRVSYITEKETNLIFLFVTSLTDKFENIKKELVKCKNEFLNLFADILQHRFDAKTFEVFDPTIDSIHRNLRPKISLVGFSGVGKTTITRLIKADEIPMQHIPTITGDIATIKIGKLHFHLWDFAGQEQFSYLWNNFIKGSDAVLLITNSTLENIEKSKYFLELIKEQAPNAQSAVIGNKQDLQGAINPVQIENMLELKTYSMIALDPKNRDKMIQIIADVLEMSAEVSPLLKPLLERDKFTEDAVRALKNADFSKAAFLFDKISDLCIELGDDSLGKEFFEKSQKIKDMLKKVGAPPPVPVTPIEPEVQKSPEILKKQEKVEETPIQMQQMQPSPPRLPPDTPVLKAKEIEQTPKTLDSSIKIELSKKYAKETSETKIKQDNLGLKLNPEDFMIRARPKTVRVVPEDAKSKLKISSEGQTKNKEGSKAPIPVSPLKLLDEKAKLSKFEASSTPKTTLKPTIEPVPQINLQKSNDISIERSSSEIPVQATSSEIKLQSDVSEITETPSIINVQQVKELKQALLDLKIRKSYLTKMSLDFDMQELKGEITPEELEDKKDKIKVMMDKIENQIQDIEKLLN